MSTPAAPTLPPTSGLYVPGSRPDRFDKALATGADLLILDLEDAVAPESKDAAREAVVAWVGRFFGTGDGGRPVLQVRVNAVGTPWHDADLAALASLPAAAGAVEVRLPKVEGTDGLDDVVAAAGPRPVTAILETARGVEAAVAVAAHPAVTRLALGESDLRSDLGTGTGPDAEAPITYARVRLLFAARAAGLDAPMLSAYPAIRDLDGLLADTVRGRALGASGRVAIHPSQLPVIARAFAPSRDEVAWARAVVVALETSGGAVTRLPDGAMVDPAMRGRATRILTRTPPR
ncbi:HpcH/HpaI aldolase/citrate lyase family protein [Serinibacter arcticus]|uniref:Hydroxymethylglutaryl-CoA lyase n=1 Tax=Serinibacter arcticus TaxID=1655435 RepID=A0A4Z1E5S6_9MICO|nr:CoA ester lyase [Serinibacter arcticus]TGO06670.1 Hydroxymethylglutaryl-CoA lyase [Serinibacter arcticus]